MRPVGASRRRPGGPVPGGYERTPLRFAWVAVKDLKLSYHNLVVIGVHGGAYGYRGDIGFRVKELKLSYHNGYILL